MDPAVGLVQAYLQLNGYFTVVEFPIIVQSAGVGEILTDVDVIAVRFPGARPFGTNADETWEPDPVLDLEARGMDLLVCEVKEGKGRLNPNLTTEDVLRATLLRVGCCPKEDLKHHVRDLLERGQALMDHAAVQCRARLAVFAGRGGETTRIPLRISLHHVTRSIIRHLRDHAGLLHPAHFTQPAMAYLQLLGKLQALRTER